MDREYQRELEGRVSTLEVHSDNLKTSVKEHDESLEILQDKFGVLVTEVKQIRNALYFMAVTIGFHIPAVADILAYIKRIF